MAEVEPGTVRFATICDDEHGFTRSFMLSILPVLAIDFFGEQRILRGGYSIQGATSVGVVEGRNEVVREFLGSAAEWLWFVDADMGYEPTALEDLMAVADPVERPIVGGLCFGFGPIAKDGSLGVGNSLVKHPFPTIFDLNETEDDAGFQPRFAYTPGVVQKCSATGAAMLLIHRSVLEQIQEKWGDVWFDRIRHPKAKKLWGEDTSFCVRAGMLGHPVYVHAGVQTSHSKVIHVTQPVYMQQLLAQPATEQVAVLVPVLGRPQNARPFMESLKASTGIADVYAITSSYDDKQAWLKAGATVLDSKGTTFAEKVNHGFKQTVEPFVFIVGDDVRFHPGWLDHAQHVARNTGAHVIGTNDLGNERVVAGEHGTHLLIRRSYVDEFGASWDGPGVVCHEGYGHMYVDDEIVTAAKQRGVWAPALSSIVEHIHPYFGKGEIDDTYRRGQATALTDRKLFMARLNRSQKHAEVPA